MTIELFTLCDGAYNYNGKLTIVGSLTFFSVSQVPTKVQMSVAIRMRVEAEEEGSRQIRIQFVNPDQTIIPADLAANVDLSSSKKISYVTLAASVQGLAINQIGQHWVRIIIDGEIMAEYPFDVDNKVEK